MIGYLGLGANIGNRQANLRQALRAIKAAGLELISLSSLYETKPVGEVSQQRDFINACVKIQTDLDPDQLLELCKKIEKQLGRKSNIRRGPRIIDIDILLLDSITLKSDKLQLPHPEILSRRFVLVPLLEIDQTLALPNGIKLIEHHINENQQIKLSDQHISLDSL